MALPTVCPPSAVNVFAAWSLLRAFRQYPLMFRQTDPFLHLCFHLLTFNPGPLMQTQSCVFFRYTRMLFCNSIPLLRPCERQQQACAVHLPGAEVRQGV